MRGSESSKGLQHGSGRYGGLKVGEGLVLIVAPFEGNCCGKQERECTRAVRKIFDVSR
jgi:hypothetical protein